MLMVSASQKPVYILIIRDVDLSIYPVKAASKMTQFSLKVRGKTLTTATQSSVALLLLSSFSAQAAILNETSERRIQVRHGNDSSSVYITPASNDSQNVDKLQGLIQQKQSEFSPDTKLNIEENKRFYISKVTPNNAYNTTYGTGNNSFGGGFNNNFSNSFSNSFSNASNINFDSWLNSNSYRVQQVANYQRYLNAQLGAHNVPPLNQLLTTARSWEKCGYEPYQLPPQDLWSNMVPTLRLYSTLKAQGILPANTEIRSVYRSPGLNDCAGGAGGSKHMTAGAIDIWVPEYDNNPWLLNSMQDGLCQYWQYQGQSSNFGLGLYATGAIHLDTQGYRKWGFNNASSYSSCRY